MRLSLRKAKNRSRLHGGAATTTVGRNRRRRILSRMLVILVGALVVGGSIWAAARFTRLLPATVRIGARTPATVEGRDARWIQDLDFLDAELTRLHVEPFHSVSPDGCRGRVARLRDEIPNLADIEVAFELRRLVAGIGDAHTSLDMDDRLSRYPVVLASVSDGVAVIAADPGHADLLSDLVVEIRGVPVEDVIAAASPFVSADSPAGKRRGALGLIVSPEFLDLIAPVPSHPPAWTLLRRGQRVRQTMSAIPADQWLSTVQNDPVSGRAPLWQGRPDTFYWWASLDEGAAVYVQYNRCRNDPEQSFADFTNEVFDVIAASPVDKLVIDLRLNGGGNSSVFDPFLAKLANHPLNRNGHLFVLVGPGTFSSAVLNAVSLDRDTEAILVGEPTGGSPNHYGEVKTIVLPNSGFVVRYPVKYFRLTSDDNDLLLPDIAIVPAAADIRSGRDPVLAWVLGQPAG